MRHYFSQMIQRVLSSAALLMVIVMGLLGPVQAAETIEVESFWLRESVPGAENGAGFGEIRNTGSEDVSIVAAESSIASSLELHQHVHRHNGQMAMEQLDALVIPAGGSVTLQPGGYHLMLMQLKSPLRVGQSHTLELRLSTGETLTVEAEVHPLVR
ncbi:copper chaperone PCu(A)C [Aliidiomarina soli]|uniref:Copper chaperone PCu(A)C n=1 Tax=Aliidiomarina soli TaxID=1928574 RepID=A0A432WDP9_9GAMM|nr:copper chaperone PCu(A)C [Aliidiomarina soli]RUO31007.1 hypothetical protein CWE14_10900 [Aliidiomarina soli]